MHIFDPFHLWIYRLADELRPQGWEELVPQNINSLVDGPQACGLTRRHSRPTQLGASSLLKKQRHESRELASHAICGIQKASMSYSASSCTSKSGAISSSSIPWRYQHLFRPHEIIRFKPQGNMSLVLQARPRFQSHCQLPSRANADSRSVKRH
jgi:hypothetical protein